MIDVVVSDFLQVTLKIDVKASMDSLALGMSLEHTNFCHKMTSYPSSKVFCYGWL